MYTIRNTHYTYYNSHRPYFSLKVYENCTNLYMSFFYDLFNTETARTSYSAYQT